MTESTRSGTQRFATCAAICITACGGLSACSDSPANSAGSASSAKVHETAGGLREQLGGQIESVSRQIESDAKNADFYAERGRLQRKLGPLLDPESRVKNDDQAVRDLETANRLSGSAGMPLALLEAARVRLRAYRFDEGFAFVSRAAKLDPGHVEIQAAVAQMEAFQTGDWNAAVSKLERLTKDRDGRKSARISYQMGYAYQQAGRAAEAEGAYRRALELDPDMRAAQVNLGLVLMDQGKTEAAVEMLRGSVTFNENDILGANNLGSALRRQGKPQEAVVVLRNVLDIAPTLPAAWLNLGNALGDLGRTDEAVSAYRRAISLIPQFVDAYNNMGIMLNKAGRSEEAVEAHQQALRIDPESTSGLYELGNALLDADRVENAVTAYKRLTQIDSKHARGWNNLGNALKSLKRYGEARESFQRCLKANPKHKYAHKNLGLTELDMGLMDEAAESFRRHLRIEPTNSTILSKLCRILVDQGKGDRAVAEASGLIARSPKSAGHYYVRATTHTELYDYDAALADFDRAIDLEPQSFRYFSRGLMHFQAGREERAVRDVAKSLELQPNDPYMSAHMWLLQLRAGNTDAARDAIAAAVKASDASKWPGKIVRYCSGEMNRNALLSVAMGNKEHQCEAYYYVGEKALLDDDRELAVKWFKKCTGTGVTNFIEHQLALWRLDQLKE